MATSELRSADIAAARQRAAAAPWDAAYTIRQAVSAFASLKLTVTLFAASIFLIFVGTLAQKDHDIWYVVQDGYFRVWFAHVEFRTFERLVQIFYPVNWGLQGGFYFPGGRILGAALFLNLIAAHAIRFKVAASGKRLWIGAGVIALGLFATWLVINTGMDEAIESDLSPQLASGVWHCVRAVLAGLALTGIYLFIMGYDRIRRTERYILLVIDVILAALAIWLLVNSETRLDNSGLRILWQLIKGAAAGGALLAGCALMFRKRAGIVLLHGGVALLMFGEFWTDWQAQESRMQIVEGQSANYSMDIRSTELAVVDPSDPNRDHVTVVPDSLLASNVGDVAAITHDDLPFAIRVREWLRNSALGKVTDPSENPATAGHGRSIVAAPVRPVSGLAEKDVDRPSSYIELFDKASGNSLGTYLVSQMLPSQPIEVGGKRYNLELRFERVYYPYSLSLQDFRFDRYVGTQTAKNFSSLVRLQDPTRNVDRDVLIWMNNPLRYAGTTFYQADFDQEREEFTVLQAVTNSGWMIPYVACMLVATGMLAHFGLMLARFVRRRQESARFEDQADSVAGQSWSKWLLQNWFPILIVALVAVGIIDLVHRARSIKVPSNEPQIYEFAELPLAYQGRIKPYDTLALNGLQYLAGRQQVVVDDAAGKETRLPAIRWLLDVIAGVPKADSYRVFSIENLDMLQTLGLEPRHGFRYALDEFRESLLNGTMDEQVELALAVPEQERSLYQNKVLELAQKLQFYGLLKQSFSSPRIADTPEKLRESLQEVQRDILRLQANSAPHAVPPADVEGQWKPLMEAEFDLLLSRATNQPTNPATPPLSALLGAYKDGDAREFNSQMARYREALADYQAKIDGHRGELIAGGMAKAEILDQRKVEFETFFNRVSPFFYCAFFYLVAFILGAISWLGWSQPLTRASTWLLYLTFAVHTAALVARVYISGRPPVTNLYSTAIFIGWAGVLLALVLESLYRLGLGNIVASVIGFLTLLVAHFLSLDGDTFIVLQAVLDTQFWLATHVVTINLGYSTTYLAGLLGIFYILFAYQFPVLDGEQRLKLMRMIYGTLCFAIFFSFVGTVLGGLWADDSWGRFWGWDPKENGALMIVLWNALVLHARWGALVAGRGLATLTVVGNIITTWSYFGVNAFGEGLHAYGGATTSTAMWLLVFAVSQLLIVALGILPPLGIDRSVARNSSSR